MIITLRKFVNISFFLFCFSFILFSTSCNIGNKYPKEVKSIDSMKVQLHKADSLIVKVDTVPLSKACIHIMITMESVKMSGKDTMSKGAAEILRNFNAVRWSLQTFLEKKNVIHSEIGKSVDQLTHLSHDLGNNLIKADSVGFYYNFEIKRASELVEAVKFGIADVNNQLPMYNMIAPQADSLISRLKNHLAL
jgi:hypothetical protein